MKTKDRVVVIGAGQAAQSVAETLREKDFDGHLILLGQEGWREQSSNFAW